MSVGLCKRTAYSPSTSVQAAMGTKLGMPRGCKAKMQCHDRGMSGKKEEVMLQQTRHTDLVGPGCLHTFIHRTRSACSAATKRHQQMAPQRL